MNKELVVRAGLDIASLGDILAKSGYFQDTRDAAQAIVKVLAGQEMGIGSIAAMTGIYIVKGRVTLSANLMAALIKRSGHYNYRVTELSDTACEIEFSENGQVIGISRFTMQDALKAKLSGDNWARFPRNMLFARALSNGAKWYTPDAFGGSPIYTPDELGAAVDEDGEVIEAEVIDLPASPAPIHQPIADQSRRIQTGPVQAPPEPPDDGQQVQQAFTDITWTRNRERVAKMIGAAEQMWAIPRPHAINRVAKALGLDNPQGEYEALFEAIAAYEGSPQDAWKMISAYKSEEETSEDPPLGELCEACGEAPIDPDAPIAGLCTVCANTALDAQADKPARKPAKK
jgi:uncharacterized protein YuzE